jgi:hypothetical protein
MRSTNEWLKFSIIYYRLARHRKNTGEREREREVEIERAKGTCSKRLFDISIQKYFRSIAKNCCRCSHFLEIP